MGYFLPHYPEPHEILALHIAYERGFKVSYQPVGVDFFCLEGMNRTTLYQPGTQLTREIVIQGQQLFHPDPPEVFYAFFASHSGQFAISTNQFRL
jgi:hypothetical protein